MLVHHHLLALGCGSGSPTLSPLQSSLQMQAARFDGASNSPRLGRRGRGAYLPDRLAAHHPASAQIGLPAEPSPSYEGFLTQRNQDTSAELFFNSVGFDSKNRRVVPHGGTTLRYHYRWRGNLASGDATRWATCTTSFRSRRREGNLLFPPKEQSRFFGQRSASE